MAWLVDELYMFKFLASTNPFTTWDRCFRRMGISMKMLVIEFVEVLL
jgi:hypothetical protein